MRSLPDSSSHGGVGRLVTHVQVHVALLPLPAGARATAAQKTRNSSSRRWGGRIPILLPVDLVLLSGSVHTCSQVVHHVIKLIN